MTVPLSQSPESSDTSAIPTMDMDAPLAMESEIHAVSIPVVSDKAPELDSEIIQSTSNESELDQTNTVMFWTGIIMTTVIVSGSIIMYILSRGA